MEQEKLERIPPPPVQHASVLTESLRVPGNNERRAKWSERYYREGWHERRLIFEKENTL